MKIAILLMLLFPSLSVACSCDKVDMEEIIKSSKYVFVATITSTKLNGSGEEFLKSVAAEFKLVASLKGNPKKLKKLYSGFGGGDCGLPLNVGFQYIIYTNDGTVDVCSRSQIYPGKNNDDGYADQVSEFIKTGKKLDLKSVYFMESMDGCSQEL